MHIEKIQLNFSSVFYRTSTCVWWDEGRPRIQLKVCLRGLDAQAGVGALFHEVGHAISAHCRGAMKPSLCRFLDPILLELEASKTGVLLAATLGEDINYQHLAFCLYGHHLHRHDYARMGEERLEGLWKATQKEDHTIALLQGISVYLEQEGTILRRKVRQIKERLRDAKLDLSYKIYSENGWGSDEVGKLMIMFTGFQFRVAEKFGLHPPLEHHARKSR